MDYSNFNNFNLIFLNNYSSNYARDEYYKLDQKRSEKNVVYLEENTQSLFPERKNKTTVKINEDTTTTNNKIEEDTRNISTSAKKMPENSSEI